MSIDHVSTGEPMADDELVTRTKTDRTAFGLLFDRYYPHVTRYCVRRLFDRDVAEDVASEVFLAVASKLRGFLGTTECDFRRWLFRIATNAVNAYLRQAGAGASSGRQPPQPTGWSPFQFERRRAGLRAARLARGLPGDPGARRARAVDHHPAVLCGPAP